MRCKGLRSVCAVLLVGVCALAVGGCSGIPELPFGNPLASLFETTSVSEALAAKADAATPTLTTPDLVAEGVLTVGIQSSGVTAPLCIVSADGTASGMDVDVASALADELGLRVRFVSVDGVEQPLNAGTCDIVMDASPDRSGSAVVVGGYYESAAAFFHRGEQGVVLASSLNAATVGLQQGSVSQGVLNKTGLLMTERTYTNLNEAFEALSAGSVDYVLCDAYPGAYLSTLYSGLAFAGTLNAPSMLGIAASSEKVAVQSAVKSALDAIGSNGVMEIIRSRWVGSMPALTASDEIQDVPGAILGGDASGEGEGTTEMASMDGGVASAGANAVTTV